MPSSSACLFQQMQTRVYHIVRWEKRQLHHIAPAKVSSRSKVQKQGTLLLRRGVGMCRVRAKSLHSHYAPSPTFREGWLHQIANSILFYVSPERSFGPSDTSPPSLECGGYAPIFPKV